MQKSDNLSLGRKRQSNFSELTPAEMNSQFIDQKIRAKANMPQQLQMNPFKRGNTIPEENEYESQVTGPNVQRTGSFLKQITFGGKQSHSNSR